MRTGPTPIFKKRGDLLSGTVVGDGLTAAVATFVVRETGTIYSIKLALFVSKSSVLGGVQVVIRTR